jgi:membrane protease subunit (stomatin/prohibitin family)
MGLIRAAIGAIGGTFADQWKDFYTISSQLAPTVAISAAVKQGTDSGRGSNTMGSENVISNGSKIIVPEGYGLVLVQDGAFTGFVTEPGGYTWDSDSLDSASVFAGNGFWNPRSCFGRCSI